MAIRRSEGGCEAPDGLHLFRRSWLAERPDRLLVLVHGFAEHSGRYEHVGRWFAERGAAVHAYDHRGHGRSGGPRNDVDRFDAFLDDLGCVLGLVRDEHPGLPITLVGHSMGGLIATAFARERGPDIDSLVTSGAALALGDSMRGLRARVLGVLARLLPSIRMEAGLPVEALSHDPEVLRLYQADPLVDTRVTARLAKEMMGAIERTAGGGSEIQVPVLVLHGGADPLCPPSGSEALFASLRPAVASRSALRIYPGLLHEIFNEPEAEAIFHDVLTWLAASRSGANAASGAA